MDENKWLRRKPQSNLDYLGITLIAVAFYMALLNAQSFLNGVNRILGILAPFAGGVVIAYCLNPIVKAAMKYLFREREKCRGLAILLAYIVGLAIVALLMVLIIPQMVGSVVMFYQNFDGYAQNLLNMLKELDAETPGVDLSLAVTAVENLNASMSDLLGTIVKAITNRVPQIISYVGGVASGVVTIFTAIASSVYLLLQKDKLLRHARVLTRAFLPKSAAETTLRICHDANRNFGGFFAGKILVCQHEHPRLVVRDAHQHHCRHHEHHPRVRPVHRRDTRRGDSALPRSVAGVDFPDFDPDYPAAGWQFHRPDDSRRFDWHLGALGSLRDCRRRGSLRLGRYGRRRSHFRHNLRHSAVGGAARPASEGVHRRGRICIRIRCRRRDSR